MRRWAVVALNPGRTRKLRVGKRRGGPAIVRIDRETKRVLRRAAGGRKIPDYWIGLPFKEIPGLERALGRLVREQRSCHRWARRCDDLPGSKCPPTTFRRKRDVFEALDEALSGKLRDQYLEVLDPGSAELGDLSQYADRKGKRKFRSWRQAVEWLAPRSRRWADLNDLALAEVSEKIREALRGAELDNMGGSFTALVPPFETEIARRKVRRRRECDDRAKDDSERLIAELRGALEALVPF